MFSEEILFNEGINNLHEPYLIPQGASQYCSNAYITSGSLQAAKSPKESTTETYGGVHSFYYKAQDEVVSSNEDRFYVEWSGFLYWSNSAGTLKRYDGTDIVDIGGHIEPETIPTVAESGGGLLSGDYLYCITYIHDDTFESAPSEIATISSVSNKKLKISFRDTAPNTATHRQIYRAGGLNPTFNLIEKVPVSEKTYTDNTSDFRVSREELNTFSNEAPPENLDMLVELHGTLFGAVGDRVYFSRQGQPEYWNGYGFVQLPTEVTGLGVVGSSVIAFTNEDMYMITGTTMNTISKTKLPFKYGCKHKRSVRSVKGRLIWLSEMDEYDVICSYAGGDVEILNKTNIAITGESTIIGELTPDDFTTETYDTIDYQMRASIVSGRKYYLFLAGRTVVVDFEFGVKTYYMAESVDGAYVKDNQLFAIYDSKVYDYFPRSASLYRNMNYISRAMSDGHLTREKTYRKIHVNGTGKWEIKVKIDDKIVYTMGYGQGSWVHLPAGLHGKTISFGVTSDGVAKIKAILYEYSLKAL